MLFTFPSRYWFTIGLRVIFSLGGRSPQIQTGFHVSRPTQVPSRRSSGFRLRGSNPLCRAFPDTSANLLTPLRRRSYNPAGRTRRFGLIPVRSPLLRESRLISLPPGTEMFQFPGFALTPYVFRCQCTGSTPVRVAPFGNPRIKGCLLLPEAYRSWPRPSSLPGAKASALCPFCLTCSFTVNPEKPSTLISGLSSKKSLK